MSITIQHTQECLSIAYVRAVAGRAGVNIGKTEHDYGVDGVFWPVTIRRNRRIETGFPIAFQLKCTTAWEYDGSDVTYDLEAKTYNDLVTRDSDGIPCLLILLCLPDPQGDWLGVTETELTLRHCCYWAFLAGEETDNTSTKRIRIPRTNVLTPANVLWLLEQERNRQKGTAS